MVTRAPYRLAIQFTKGAAAKQRSEKSMGYRMCVIGNIFNCSCTSGGNLGSKKGDGSYPTEWQEFKGGSAKWRCVRKRSHHPLALQPGTA